MFGSLLKAAKGVTSIDQLNEVLSLVGITAELRPVTLDEAGRALQIVKQPGVQMVLMEGTMKDGSRIVSLMVFPGDAPAVESRVTAAVPVSRLVPAESTA